MSAPASTAEIPDVTVGVTGQQTRWSVSPWGSITPWGHDSPVSLDWFVAADDRWHVPSQEPTVRQQRIEGTPVIETRIRIPDGDAVQRVWAAPDAGGTVVVEFENESPMPFAVALTGPGVVTERPAADVPIEGIELPDDAIVLPVGHRATVRVAIPAGSGGDGARLSLGRLPPMLAAVRGWTSVVERASRLVLPDERLVDALVAARCDLLLEGPSDPDDDPIGFLLDVGELVRCGDSADAWLLDVVVPAENVARRAAKRSRSEPTPLVESLDALGAARLVAARARDGRAVGDIDKMSARVRAKGSAGALSSEHASFADLRRGTSVGRFVRSIERRIASDGRLLAGGIPTSWLGSSFEVHHVPTIAPADVSFAVRWHGERPAILWEQHGGAPITLTAPDVDADWQAHDVSGEALWSVPKVERPAKRSLTINPDPDGGSFS